MHNTLPSPSTASPPPAWQSSYPYSRPKTTYLQRILSKMLISSSLAFFQLQLKILTTLFPLLSYYRWSPYSWKVLHINELKWIECLCFIPQMRPQPNFEDRFEVELIVSTYNGRRERRKEHYLFLKLMLEQRAKCYTLWETQNSLY